MTEIAIQPLTAANQGDLNRCDNSFTVEAKLRPTAEHWARRLLSRAGDTLCQALRP